MAQQQWSGQGLGGAVSNSASQLLFSSSNTVIQWNQNASSSAALLFGTGASAGSWEWSMNATADSGANVKLYATSHATKPGLLEFRSSAVVRNTFDLASNTATFGGNTSVALSQNSQTSFSVVNTNAGASAVAKLLLTSDAGSIDIRADSTALGADVRMLFGSGFTGGTSIEVLGANPFTIKTNAITGLSVSGAQIVSIPVQLIAHGTSTNDSAASGYIGEYIESLITTLTTIPDTSGTYGDLTTITLTAGDWDITACVDLEGNGGTVTSIVFGISQTTGNSSTGLVLGVNQGDFSSTLVTSGGREFYSIPSYRQSLATSTAIYFKYQLAYAVATPKYKCRISARRVR